MKCLTIDVHFMCIYIWEGGGLRLFSQTFNSCSDTGYVTKKRLLEFGRFLYVGALVFCEVRMAVKEIWLRFLLLLMIVWL